MCRITLCILVLLCVSRISTARGENPELEPAPPTPDDLLFSDAPAQEKKHAAERIARGGGSGRALLHAASVHGDPSTRAAAAHGFSFDVRAEHLAPLLALLDDPDPTVRREAIATLGFYKRWRDLFGPRLVARLDVPSERGVATHALARLRYALPQVIHTLRADLAAAMPEDVRYSALGTVCFLGRDARELVPEVASCLDDVDQRDQPGVALRIEMAVIALEAIGGADAARAADKVAKVLLEHGTYSDLTLDALLSMGPDGASQAAAVVTFMEQDPAYFGDAITVLGAMGPGAKAALPHMPRALVVCGSITSFPEAELRSMAAIDIDAAIDAIEADIKAAPSRRRSYKCHDYRREAIDRLEALRSQARSLGEALASGRDWKESVPEAPTWMSLSTGTGRALRPGDSFERLIALMGWPPEKDGKTLRYHVARDPRGVICLEVSVTIHNGAVADVRRDELRKLHPSHVTEGVEQPW